jgi:hypothetical protein
MGRDNRNIYYYSGDPIPELLPSQRVKMVWMTHSIRGDHMGDPGKYENTIPLSLRTSPSLRGKENYYSYSGYADSSLETFD